jgi:hypothetical protein
MVSNELPLAPDLMVVFQKTTEELFGEIARGFDSELERVSPQLYGFLAKYAVVTIGVYHGHFPNICVKLCDRQPNDKSVVQDESRSIGLEHFITYAGTFTPIKGRSRWTEATIKMELGELAANLSSYGRPFLTESHVDWQKFRDWLLAKIKVRSSPSDLIIEPDLT